MYNYHHFPQIQAMIPCIMQVCNCLYRTRTHTRTCIIKFFIRVPICIVFVCAASGKLTPDDILVLRLDMTQFDTHQAATDKVLDHFKQVINNRHTLNT